MNQGDIITLYLSWCELLMARTSFNKRKLATPFVQKKKTPQKTFQIRLYKEKHFRTKAYQVNKDLSDS